MTASQKRGRTFLIAALILVATFILNGFLESVSTNKMDLFEGILGNGTLLLMLVLAYRGGRLSLKLTKGCVILFAVVVTILLLVVSLTWIRGIPLPEPPSPANTVSFIAMTLGVGYCVWALFLSSDVKRFVMFRRSGPATRGS